MSSRSRSSIQRYGSIHSLTSQDSVTSFVEPNGSGIVDADCELSSWFLSGLPRQQIRTIAKRMIKYGEAGNFLIRDIKTEPNSFGLSIKLKDGTLGNYLIKNSSHGFVIRGTQKYFSTMSGLVDYYASKMRPGLGVQLLENDAIRDGEFNDHDLDMEEEDEQLEAPSSRQASVQLSNPIPENTRARMNRKLTDTSSDWKSQNPLASLGDPRLSPTKTKGSFNFDVAPPQAPSQDIYSHLQAVEAQLQKFREESAEVNARIYEAESSVNAYRGLVAPPSQAPRSVSPTKSLLANNAAKPPPSHVPVEAVRPWQLKSPASAGAKQPGARTPAGQQQAPRFNAGVKVSGVELNKTKIEDMRRREHEEQGRRVQFDVAQKAELAQVKLLPFSLQRDGLLRLNSQEQQELMRRRKWDMDRDQIQAQIVSQTPESSLELQLHIADMVDKEKRMAEQSLQQQLSALDEAGYGKVKLLSGAFKPAPAPAQPKLPNTMAWKRPLSSTVGGGK